MGDDLRGMDGARLLSTSSAPLRRTPFSFFVIYPEFRHYVASLWAIVLSPRACGAFVFGGHASPRGGGSFKLGWPMNGCMGAIPRHALCHPYGAHEFGGRAPAGGGRFLARMGDERMHGGNSAPCFMSSGVRVCFFSSSMPDNQVRLAVYEPAAWRGSHSE